MRSRSLSDYPQAVLAYANVFLYVKGQIRRSPWRVRMLRGHLTRYLVLLPGVDREAGASHVSPHLPMTMHVGEDRAASFRCAFVTIQTAHHRQSNALITICRFLTLANSELELGQAQRWDACGEVLSMHCFPPMWPWFRTRSIKRCRRLRVLYSLPRRSLGLPDVFNIP